MPNDVSLCNSALLKIGGERITSLTENSRSAIVCNEQYSKIRDLVLRSHPWNFALKRATLAPLAETPEFDYKYAYQLPADCLRVLDTQDSGIIFKIEGRKILTDADMLQIRYIYRNLDTSQYDASFCEAFACRLGAEVAYVITQNVSVGQTLYNMFKELIAEARRVDAQEGSPEAFIVDTWTNARF